MSNKILILHGWMHSAERYKKLKEELERKIDCRVTIYEFPGFGNTKTINRERILWGYVEQIRTQIKNNEYDFVIGHSMGGNILLKAIQEQDLKPTVILLSPVYMGILVLKPLSVFVPLVPLALKVMQKHKNCISVFLIKCMALLTVNSWAKIDDIIVQDSMRADAFVAATTMFELIWDRWRLNKRKWKSGKVFLILGKNDRIISRYKMKKLCEDLPVVETNIINGIGHTAVVEAFDELVEIITKIIRQRKG